MAGLGRQDLVRLMIGRTEQIPDWAPRDHSRAPSRCWSCTSVSTALGHADIDLTVRQGEIVGLYGLVGAGRTELAKCDPGPLSADRRRRSRSTGRPERIGSVADAIHRYGIGYVSEDRKQEGLILAHTVLENAGITVWRKLAGRLGLLRDDAVRAHVEPVIAQLEVRTPSLAQIVGNLSGGNQQKISVAKWLAAGVQDPHRRRALGRHRHQDQGLPARAAAPSRRPGHRHPADHQRHAGDDHARRPHRRDGRLPHQGRTRELAALHEMSEAIMALIHARDAA